MLIIGGRFRTGVPPFPHDALPRSLRSNLGEVFHCLYLIDHYLTVVVWRRWGQPHFMENRCSIVWHDHLWIFVVIWTSVNDPILKRILHKNSWSTSSETSLTLKWHGSWPDHSKDNSSQRHFPSSDAPSRRWKLRCSPTHLLPGQLSTNDISFSRTSSCQTRARQLEKKGSENVVCCILLIFVACLLKEGQLLWSACRNGSQGQRTCFRWTATSS